MTGRNEDESVVATYSETGTVPPKRVWNFKSHNAEVYGTDIVAKCIGKGNFNFPKSLYAVHDALRFFVADKPDALILDFFAGSGTTLHAVNLLNAEDGGRRRCVMVTNNEVSEAEARAMSARGLKPGDEAWEAQGIARHVTWPRTVCSIEGRDVNGRPLAGDYGVEVDSFEEDADCVATSRETGRPVRGKRYRKAKRQLYPALAGMRMADGFRANAAFFRLSFLDGDSVALGNELQNLLPLLWLKAGGHGTPPRGGDEAAKIKSHAESAEANSHAESAEGLLLFPENRFAVLTDERAFPRLKAALAEGGITTAFLATDDGAAFRAMARSLGRGVRCFRLYRDYLDHFRVNRERT